MNIFKKKIFNTDCTVKYMENIYYFCFINKIINNIKENNKISNNLLS